jgi:hypothetical protein
VAATISAAEFPSVVLPARARICAREVLHDDERAPAAVQIAVEDLDDAGVAHRGRRARLREEAVHDVGVLGQLGAQHFDGGVASHVAVAPLIHLPHRSRARARALMPRGAPYSGAMMYRSSCPESPPTPAPRSAPTRTGNEDPTHIVVFSREHGQRPQAG